MDDPSRQPEGAKKPESTEGRPETPGAPVEQRPRPFHPGLPAGTGLGKYRILERLWTTHNAIVYKARDAMLDRLVLIKQMSPALMDNPVACGHFKREAQFLARVPKDAKHVVNIHELIEDDLGLFIVEEYVVGHWLESLIAKRQTDPLAGIRVLRTAAQGLRTLHALELMHRGIQPSNIIVARNGSAKIANLTTAAHEGDTTPPPTVAPKYSAPELLTGGTYDNRADIYSLGLVIYEFCVGRRELHARLGQAADSSAAAVDLWSRWHADAALHLPEASELNPLVPPALSSIIRRMTAKNLDERYTSIQEVLDALARHFDAAAERPEWRQLMPFAGGPLSRSAQGAAVQGFVFESRTTGSLLPLYGAPVLAPTAIPPTSKHTVRQPVEMPALSAGGGPVEPPSLSPAEPVEVTRLRAFRRHPGLRPTLMLRPQARPNHPEAIPAPALASETHRRHPRLIAWMVSGAIFLGAAAAGVATLLLYYHSGPRQRSMAERLLAEGLTAYEQSDYNVAKQKFFAAAQSSAASDAALRAKDRAESWLPMAESRLALARNEFDEALHYARRAEKRGLNPAEATELQQLIWAKKDAYRLEAEGSKALEEGRLQEAELTVDEYKQKAQEGGLDSSRLTGRLEASKADKRFDEAIKRARKALDRGDREQASLAVSDAERIRSTSETRQLRLRITAGKERADLILRGDNAMLDKDYGEAALAYEKADQIEAAPEIEKKARTAAALLLMDKAQQALDKGDLLSAERHLRSSLWKSPTQQAGTRLEKLAPAFEAARTVRKADEEMENGHYAEAERLYVEAIPSLPPPADAAANDKLLKARQQLALQRGDEAFERGDWQDALDAYQKAKELGRNGEVTKKIELLKAKLRQ